jgi:hypothetical protein
MATTYEPIATTTLSTATQSVTFTSISGSFTDLVLVAQGLASSETNWEIQFNSDTGSNYSSTYLYGTGSVAASGRQSNVANIASTRVDTNSVFIAHINNYSNTTTYKTLLGRTSNAGIIVYQTVGLWRSTSAITSIKVNSQNVNFNSGSTFTLYGIKSSA